jgi:hypothetical protein
MMNAAPMPEGTMAEETNEPRDKADEQQAEDERRRTRESDHPETPEQIREDVAEDDRFQSTDN